MLQIRLNKDLTAEGGRGGGAKVSEETVTVACPDHLVLAHLPVAKSLGFVSVTSLVKTVGRRSRRQLGERIHFCVRCDFPIAIYGRLSPCEHAYCLDCARSDSICYLCDERIQKIQTIKMMEGIFVCAAPHCLKSFLKRVDFESHVQETHANLLQPNVEKEEVNESTVSDSTARAPSRPPGFSPTSNSQLLDRQQQQSRLPFFGQNQNRQSESQPNYAVPFTPNLSQNAPPGLSHPHFQAEGAQPFYNSYEMARQDSIPEVGSQQGSLLGFPPRQAVPMNFPATYPQPWNPGAAGMPFAPPLSSQGYAEGFTNATDSQGRSAPFHGSFGQAGSGTG